jgi:hypothetical protein
MMTPFIDGLVLGCIFGFVGGVVTVIAFAWYVAWNEKYRCPPEA